MKDNRKKDERSTGTEEPWDTQRISLLRSLFWSANYMAGLKSQLLNSYDIGVYQAGDLKVSIQRGKRRLDTKRFQERFPVASNPKCYEVSPLSLSKLEKLVGSETLGDLIVRGRESVKVE